ncbi:hypothetical protein [Legionella sp. WA2022007384]
MQEINLMLLQKKQIIHDIKYHSDIMYLPLPDRLKHIVLHLSKYAGKLLLSKNFEKECADIMICCLALGNVLKHRLNITLLKRPQIYFKDYIHNYIISVSKIAKAVEALDHIENYPSFKVLTCEIDYILTQTIMFTCGLDINPIKIIHNRWDSIEEKFFIPKD